MNDQATAKPDQPLIQKPSEQETDILIVGAGPTGLTAAIELARRGVAFRIVDKYPRAEHSNALVMHARTLEVMELIGVADTLIGEGYRRPRYRPRFRLAEADSRGDVPTGHPFSVHFSDPAKRDRAAVGRASGVARGRGRAGYGVLRL